MIEYIHGMKFLFTLVLLTGIAYGQVAPAPSEVHYSAAGIYLTIMHDKVEESRKPMGKDVSITYDTFFKSYNIYYMDEDGLLNLFKLTYMGDQPNGTEVPEYKMKDDTGAEYLVLDMLGSGMLKILLLKDYPNSRFAWIRIEGAVVTQIPTR